MIGYFLRRLRRDAAVVDGAARQRADEAVALWRAEEITRHRNAGHAVYVCPHGDGYAWSAMPDGLMDDGRTPREWHELRCRKCQAGRA